MYIFELIAQLFKTKKYKQQNSFDPLNSETDEYEEKEEDNNTPTPDKVDEIKVTEEKTKEKGSIRIDDIDFDSISNFDDSL